MASQRSHAKSKDGDESNSSGESTSSSKSLVFYRRSTAEIDYCIRTINLIISTMSLSIAEIHTLEQLTMETLLRIHCALLDIHFSEEFIPSSNPKEDAQRIILSLKDRFGADKFGSLEADKIAKKNPTQLRFLLENFHLILNHRLAKESKSKKETELIKSDSGNHLSVRKPSLSDVKAADSFYIMDTLSDGKGKEPTDDSFQTVDNVVVKVYDDSTSDESTSDELFESEIGPRPSPKAKFKKTPITSSPIVTSQKSSCRTPNVSVIRHSKSALGNLHKTINSTNSQHNKSKARSQSLQSRKPYTSKYLKNTRPSSSLSQAPHLPLDENDKLKKMSTLHSKIRNQISESILSLNKDIAQLTQWKRKPASSQVQSKSTKEVCCKQPASNLRWLMPVDARFPYYCSSVIIPKCIPKKAYLPRPPSACSKPFRNNCPEGAGASSVVAQKGSQLYEIETQEFLNGYDD